MVVVAAVLVVVRVVDDAVLLALVLVVFCMHPVKVGRSAGTWQGLAGWHDEACSAVHAPWLWGCLGCLRPRLMRCCGACNKAHCCGITWAIDDDLLALALVVAVVASVLIVIILPLEGAGRRHPRGESSQTQRLCMCITSGLTGLKLKG